MLNIRTKSVESSRLITSDRFAITDPQRYALLIVRGGRAAGALREHMDEMSWPHPGDADFAALIAAGLVRYDARLISLGYPYSLTPNGLTAATAVSQDLCVKFRVHILTTLDGRPGVAPRGVCSCGMWTHAAPRNSSAMSRIGVAFATHEAQAAAGFDPGRALEARLAAIANSGREVGHG